MLSVISKVFEKYHGYLVGFLLNCFLYTFTHYSWIKYDIRVSKITRDCCYSIIVWATFYDVLIGGCFSLEKIIPKTKENGIVVGYLLFYIPYFHLGHPHASKFTKFLGRILSRIKKILFVVA